MSSASSADGGSPAGAGSPVSRASTEQADPAVGATALSGKTFRSTAARGRTLAVPVVIEFTGQDPMRISASPGCNRFSAPVRVTDGRLAPTGPIAGTERACADAQMQQEEWFGSWLQGGLAVAFDGATLKLTGDAVTVTFVPFGSAVQSADPAVGGRPTATVLVPEPAGSSGPNAPSVVTTPATARGTTARPTGPQVTVDRPQPSVGPAKPGDEPVGAALLDRLDGHTFALVRTWTDAGAENRMAPGLTIALTFTGRTATISGDCSLTYPQVSAPDSGRQLPALDLGTPQGGPCTVGNDPAAPPVGEVMALLERLPATGSAPVRDQLTLSTGTVMWIFVQQR